MIRSSLILLALLTSGACIFDTTMSVAGFDTSCVQDQDCAPVQEGDICGCDCGNAAINVKGAAMYQAELSDKASHCTRKVFCDCVSVSAVCVQGQCTIKAP
jgi:hypothetical protein